MAGSSTRGAAVRGFMTGSWSNHVIKNFPPQSARKIGNQTRTETESYFANFLTEIKGAKDYASDSLQEPRLLWNVHVKTHAVDVGLVN